MKPHLELKLKGDVRATDAPFWADALRDKSQVPDTLHPDIDRILRRHGLRVWVLRAYRAAGSTWSAEELASGLDRVYRLVLQEQRRLPESLLGEVSLLPVVQWVRLGKVGRTPLPVPRAAALSASTGRQSREAIGLEEAHQFSAGEPSITVAVLDTGVCQRHPELRGRLLPGYDFVDIIDGARDFVADYLEADPDPEDEVGHGTHVAAIIAGLGVRMPRGVVPRCKLLPVRVLGAMRQGERRIGAGLLDNINTGIKWAVDQGADVINMSLGVRHAQGGLPHQDVVEYARRKGVTLVAASGNDGTAQLYYPGALPHVVAVGACDERGEVAPFSTFGEQVSLVAPGTNIYSAYLEDDYAFSTGTSHAAPFVAGAVALLKSHARRRYDHRLTDRQVKYLLQRTADKVDGRFKHHKAGFGRLNLPDALRLLDHQLTRGTSRASQPF